MTGKLVEAVHVKGSGWDLASIEAPGLAPPHLPRLHELLELESLSDPDMMRERRNLLSAEITSQTVARSVASLCTDDFAATTGAQVPIDGGNERVV